MKHVPTQHVYKYVSVRPFLVAFILLVAPSFAGAQSSDLTNGIELLRSGDGVAARALLQNVWRDDTNSAVNRFWYAISLQDGAEAMPHFALLVNDSLAPDSLRIESSLRLGGYAEMNGDAAQAKQWKARARVLRAGKDPVAAPQASVKSVAPKIIAPVSTANDSVKNSFATAIGTFVVQAGSFGAQVNAQGLQKKLAALYDDVRIEPFQTKGTTFYRVRIGRFESRDSAEKFIKKARSRTPLSFSVIEE